MAEVEDGRTIQVNGIDTEEMKTKIGEDDATLNDEPLNVENCQASEVALEEMRSDELNEVKEMDERAALEEQQEDELSTMVENNELNSMKIMEQAVGRVEVEDELDHKETDETGIDEEKIQMVADEGVEEQVVEDRTEDQVPDITGTDNADVMATSMDSIEELPTSEEQAIETSALAEQEAQPPIKSKIANVEVASTTETELLTEEERTAMSPKVEVPQKINEIEIVLEKEAAPAEKATAVNEAPKKDDEAEELPTKQNTAFPEAKSELEIHPHEAQLEVGKAQDTLKHTEPIEVTEVVKEIITEQSLATSESEAVIEEFLEVEEGTEEIRKEDIDSERNESDNINLSDEEQRSKAWDNEAVDINEENVEDKDDFASSPVQEEKSETIHRSESSEAKDEPDLEMDAKQAVVEAGVAEINAEVPIEELKDERKSPPPARQIISSPPRRRSPSPIRKRQERSPSPIRREDTHRQRGPPPRTPTYLSFSSYIPVEKTAYSPISPWVQNAAQKYRNDYTAVSTYKSPSIYTSIFDDIVNSGPFSSDLYSTSRLLERSRSRSRELRNALRSKRSTSNYYRYTSNYATPPLRTRDYSTPPFSSVYRSSSRSGSFISFLEYSGQKQYELSRSSSRYSALDGLSRASSRSNVDMFYNGGRLSRVDNYVRNLNRKTEYGFPSTYASYRSPSRPYLPQEYTPVTGYRAYPATNSPSSSALGRLYSGFTRHWTMGS